MGRTRVLAIIVLVAVTAGFGPLSAMLPAAHAAPPSVIRVVKTEQVNGERHAAAGHWAFTLQGPDGTSNGVFDPNNPGPTSLKRTNENGRENWIDWRRDTAGDYRLCEKFFGGWRSNLGGSAGDIQPNGDRCVEFSFGGAADDEVFLVNNRCTSG